MSFRFTICETFNAVLVLKSDSTFEICTVSRTVNKNLNFDSRYMLIRDDAQRISCITPVIHIFRIIYKGIVICEKIRPFFENWLLNSQIKSIELHQGDPINLILSHSIKRNMEICRVYFDTRNSCKKSYFPLDDTARQLCCIVYHRVSCNLLARCKIIPRLHGRDISAVVRNCYTSQYLGNRKVKLSVLLYEQVHRVHTI